MTQVPAAAPAGTVRSWLDRRADHEGSRTSHLFPDAPPLTWADLRDDAARIARCLGGMGLPKGAKQVVLAEVEIVDVRVEPLENIHHEIDGTAREGLSDMTSDEFIAFWRGGHGYASDYHGSDVPCRRIEWRYLRAEQEQTP